MVIEHGKDHYRFHLKYMLHFFLNELLSKT